MIRAGHANTIERPAGRDKHAFRLRSSHRCWLLLSCLSLSLGDPAYAELKGIVLSPTLGRPAVIKPGERIHLRVAGLDGQSLQSARLISPREPIFAQPLILGSGEQTVVADDRAVELLVPPQTPSQVYNLELRTANQQLLTRQAVVILDAARTQRRVAHINEASQLTHARMAELNRWNVDAIAVSAVRLEQQQDWSQLLSTLATSAAPVLLAPGAGVDLAAFSQHVSPSLTAQLPLGPLRLTTAVSTPERPLSSDAEQLRWISEWLQSGSQGVIVLDQTAEWSSTPAPLILDSASSDADYQIIEWTETETHFTPSKFGSLEAETIPVPQLAPHAIQLVIRNRHHQPIDGVRERVVLANTGRPWCLGGKISQVVGVDNRQLVDWVGDVPAEGVISVLIGAGPKPSLPQVIADFETPAKLTPSIAARGVWGRIRLHNTSATDAQLRPLVLLAGVHIPYSIRGLDLQGSGNYRLQLGAGEVVELELLPPNQAVSAGPQRLQLYLTQLPVWQTLNQPITLAAD